MNLQFNCPPTNRLRTGTNCNRLVRTCTNNQHFATDVNALRLSLLFVPSELIVPSETTWLNCTYDLENDHLYAIQWYKIIDGKAEEFYRYMPEQWPSVTIYEMPGVYVDVSCP